MHNSKSIFYPALFAMAAFALWGPPFLSIVYSLASDGIAPNIGQSDFANYWLGGKFAIEGKTNLLYQQDAYFRQMQSVFGDDIEIRAWSYPPHTLLFLWPLGFFSYKTAMIVFLGSGIVLYAGSALSAFRQHGNRDNFFPFLISLVPYMVMMLACMQNGFHLGAVAIAGFLLFRRHPLLAGLCFAILTVKPQLGILIPFLLIFEGAWRSVIWAAAFTILLLIASVVVFGLQDWQDFWTYTIPYQSGVMHDWHGVFLQMMPGLFASLRVIGLDSQLAQSIHLVGALLISPLVVWLLYREKDWAVRLMVLLCGTFLITPYSFNYDMGALSLVAGIILSRTSDHAPYSQFCWAFFAAFPAFILLLGAFGLPIAPVLLLLLLLMPTFLRKRLQFE